MGTHSPCLKYSEEEAGRCRPLWGAYRRLEDEGYRRVQEAGVYRPVSPHSNLGLLEYLTSWVSSPRASEIHVVACFGDNHTSVIVLAPLMSGHPELADV